MAAKRKSLVKQGSGNNPKAGCELIDKEEAKLFERGEFGSYNLHALQHPPVVCFRARDESTMFYWGDIVLDVDAQTGHLVLIWTA